MDTATYPTPQTSEEQLRLAQKAADKGDVSHTVLHTQRALVLSLQELTNELRALRQLTS